MTIETVRSITGLQLAIKEDGGRYYLGPEDFLKSELFSKSKMFRARHLVTRTISNTVFTTGTAYQLNGSHRCAIGKLPNREKDLRLIKVVKVGEGSIEWNPWDLHSLQVVDAIIPMDILDTDLSSFLMVTGSQTRMFEDPEPAYLLQEKTYFDVDDPDYTIKYHSLPESLAMRLIGSKERHSRKMTSILKQPIVANA